MMNRTLKTIMLATTLAVPAGCASYGNPPDQPMGSALQQMQQQQTAYPAAGVINADRMADLDGPKGEKVLSTYRADVSEPQAIQNAIQVNIGN
jgi:hypothetical protein